MLPKRGGGREAFKSGEARMPGEQDDDYDGINSGWFGGKDGGRTKPRMRWNRFKWILFISNIVVSKVAAGWPAGCSSMNSSAYGLRPRRSHFLPPYMVRYLDPR